MEMRTFEQINEGGIGVWQKLWGWCLSGCSLENAGLEGLPVPSRL